MVSYEDRLKGRFAEALVEALFHGSGIKVWRTGFEWLPSVFHVGGTNIGFEEGHELKDYPDFRIMWSSAATRRGMVHEYIEVKYRADGKLEESAINKLISSHLRPTLILVQKRYPRSEVHRSRFQVTRYPYRMMENGYLYSEPITDQSHWGINEEVYDRCEKWLDEYLL